VVGLQWRESFVYRGDAFYRLVVPGTTTTQYEIKSTLGCQSSTFLRNTVLCCVKIQNNCSEYFQTRQGLRQRNVLSKLIFKVVLESIVRQAELQTNGTVFNKQTQILGNPNDIDIMGRSQAAVREVFLALEREANKEGLKINESKTKHMIAAGNDTTIREVGQSVAFGDKTFEVVKEFVYL
jgi:Reverse transcriptase (RNA-dependent DNA polymerase)